MDFNTATVANTSTLINIVINSYHSMNCFTKHSFTQTPGRCCWGRRFGAHHVAISREAESRYNNFRLLWFRNFGSQINVKEQLKLENDLKKTCTKKKLCFEVQRALTTEFIIPQARVRGSMFLAHITVSCVASQAHSGRSETANAQTGASRRSRDLRSRIR